MFGKHAVKREESRTSQIKNVRICSEVKTIVTDNEIISALRVSQTKTEAAEMLGIGRTTLYERISRPEFIEALEQAAEAERQATEDVLHGAVCKAIEYLDSVISDETFFGCSNAEKIRAAQILLNYDARM